MSINRLNLQIGGNKEVKEDSLLEEVGLSFAVDDLLEELIPEVEEEITEEHGDFLVKALDKQFPPEEPTPIDETFLMESLGEAVDFPIPRVEEPERILTRQERLAESLTHYNTRTNQTLTEVEAPSDTTRIKLLEDAFAKMKRAQPQTLVTGIGASLDSGGGAVWLWDLEDVNIGTPNPQTSQYPAIANGAVLKYNELTNQWYAGTASSDTVEVTTAQIDLTNPQGEDDTIPNQNDIVGYTALGTLTTQLDWNKKIYDYFGESLPLKGGTICADATINTGAEDGILKIQSTGSTTGKLILVDSNDNTSATLSAQLGQASFNSGVTAGTFVQTSATATSAFTNANFSGVVGLNDDTTVASTKELVFNRGNINTSIGGLVIKGITAAGAGAANPQIAEILNVTYGNTVAGTASSNNKADAVNYMGKTEGSFNIVNKQYVDDAVAAGAGVAFQFDGTCNVLLPLSNAANSDVKESAGYFYINQGAQGVANSEWTGIAGLVIATNQLIIWSGTESRWFAGAIEDESAYLLRSGGESQIMTGTLYTRNGASSGTKSIIFANQGAQTGYITTGGTFTTDGNVTATKVSATGQVIAGSNIQATDYVRSGTYLQANSYLTVKANSNLNNDTDANRKVSIARAGNNNGAYVNFEILGNNCVNAAGQPQDALINTYINNAGSSSADYIRYHGRTNVDDAPQTRASCDARYAQLGASNSFTGTSNTFKEIVLQDTGTGGDSLSNYLLLCKTKSGTQTVEIMAEKGHILLKKGGSEVQVVRGDTSGGDSTTGGINLLGCQPGSTTTTKDLLRCKYYVSATNTSTKTGDSIEYFGRQDLADCIMSRSNIDTMITDAIDTNNVAVTTAWALAYGTGGGIFDSNSYINYRIINNSTIQLIIRLSNGGAKIFNNQISFAPGGAFTTVLENTVGGAFQVITKEREVLQATIGTTSSSKNLVIPAVSGGTQDVQGWAFLPYGKP